MSVLFKVKLTLIWITVLTVLPDLSAAPTRCAIEIEARRVAAIEEAYFLVQFRTNFTKWQIAAGEPHIEPLSRRSGTSRHLLYQWLAYGMQLKEPSIRKHAPALATALGISEEQFLNAAGYTSRAKERPSLEKYPAVYAGYDYQKNRSLVERETAVSRIRTYQWEKNEAHPARWEIRAIALWEASRLNLKGYDAIEEWVTRRYWDYGFLPRPIVDSEAIPRWLPTWGPNPKLEHLAEFVKAPAQCFSEEVVRAWRATGPGGKIYSAEQAAISLNALRIKEIQPETSSPQRAREVASAHHMSWNELSNILGMSYFLPKFGMWLEWWIRSEDLPEISRRARILLNKFRLEVSPATAGQFSRREVLRLAQVLGASPYEALMAAGYFPTAEDRLRVRSR